MLDSGKLWVKGKNRTLIKEQGFGFGKHKFRDCHLWCGDGWDRGGVSLGSPETESRTSSSLMKGSR